MSSATDREQLLASLLDLLRRLPGQPTVTVDSDHSHHTYKLPPLEVGSEPAERLNELEAAVLAALAAGDQLTGEDIAGRTIYPYDSRFKSCLSALRRRGLVDNRSPGYLLTPKGRAAVTSFRQASQDEGHTLGHD